MRMKKRESFKQKTNYKYCPHCSSSKIKDHTNHIICENCGYQIYFNVAASTSCILTNHEKLLVIKRKYDPGKEKLDLPGGFIDFDESLEDGMQRELLEELGYAPLDLKYFSSYPDTYIFKNIQYHTMNCVFTAELSGKVDLIASDDALSLDWVNIDKLDLSLFAFESVKKALSDFISQTIK